MTVGSTFFRSSARVRSLAARPISWRPTMKATIAPSTLRPNAIRMGRADSRISGMSGLLVAGGGLDLAPHSNGTADSRPRASFMSTTASRRQAICHTDSRPARRLGTACVELSRGALPSPRVAHAGGSRVHAREPVSRTRRSWRRSSSVLPECRSHSALSYVGSRPLSHRRHLNSAVTVGLLPEGPQTVGAAHAGLIMARLGPGDSPAGRDDDSAPQGVARGVWDRWGAEGWRGGGIRLGRGRHDEARDGIAVTPGTGGV